MSATSLTNQVTYHTVSADKENQRLDNYLTVLLKGVPKSRIYRLIRKGEVRVNKKRVGPDYKVQVSDVIRIPPIRKAEANKERKVSTNLSNLLKSRILYEDDDLLVLNKPSGISVHGGLGSTVGIIEALRIILPTIPNLELVHRLDKDTSGCLMFSKKHSVLRELHTLITEGKIEKTYSLLVRGHWPEKKKRVSLALQKNLLSSGERIVRVVEEGKTAITEFKPIHYYANATLLEALLITGRMHQIRVHTAHSGYPIAGDQKYGDKTFNQLITKLGSKRLFLHAKKIRFSLPSSGKIYEVKAEFDKEFQQILDDLE